MLSKINRKRVMGIDGSTNSLAYSIYHGDKLISDGIFFFYGKTLPQRLVDARKKISAIRQLKEEFNVDIIAIEKAIYVQNKVSFAALAKMFGVIESILGEKTEIMEVTPTTWYKIIGNEGATPSEKATLKKNNPGRSAAWYQAEAREIRKQKTKDWVKRTHGLGVKDDNVADAIAIGYAGVELIKRR